MEHKQDLVVDIDEVIADTMPQIAAWHNANYKTSLQPKDYYTYRIYEVWGITKAQTSSRMREFYKSDYFHNIKPVEGAIEGIDELSKKFNLHIVTGRIDDIKPQTLQYLDKYHSGKISSIEFTSYHIIDNPVKKSEVCKKLGARLIIEDDLEHAMDCAQNGIKVLLYDRPWNQGASHKNIIRVHSWKEILKEINRIIF